MKLLPIQLPSSGSMDRLPPLPMPFNPSDLLWRYSSFSLSNAAAAAAAAAAAPPPPPPASPLLDFKTQLPNALATDPRIWSREDVTTFLRWCEREFDLPTFDMDMFQMNGKALCFLTKTDLGERCPGAGDVLHNVLQMLVRDAQSLQRHLPSSPVTPTSRHLSHAYPALPAPHAPPPLPHPLSPAHTHQPPTPTWGLLSRNVAGGTDGGGGGGPGGGGGTAPASHLPSGLAHLMGVAHNSVTLSPAPSVDSQSGSPQHPLDHTTTNVSSFPMLTGYSGSNGSSGSNQSDSEEDLYQEGATNGREQSCGGSTGSTASTGSPPSTPSYLATTALSNLHTSTPQSPRSPANAKEPLRPPSQSATHNGTSAATNGSIYPSREFFPDTPEPNTNGRLLWDFLQQLLNDPSQRYTSYIAWKNSETGVFKIVDPAGLAKLWGIQKNHLSMNYDKMSRALRYYYRVNILRKVQGERHCYQFLRNPTELKNIKNISLLRQQMSPTRPAASLYSGGGGGGGGGAQGGNHHAPPQSPAPVMVKSDPDMMIKMEPKVEIEEGVESEQGRECDELPTDLSMVSLQQQQQQRQQEQQIATDLSSKFNSWESRESSSESQSAFTRKTESSSATSGSAATATGSADAEDAK